MNDLKHICFVDDDPDEIGTFERLYDGAVFTVTSILAQNAGDAVSQLDRRLKSATPDLFVLDLYFPLSADSPISLSDTAAATHGLDRINDAVQQLRTLLDTSSADGKQLLRHAHSVVNQSRVLLDDWCKQLNQSPQGGIQLIRQLDSAFPKVPKVFYSRKATLQDVKDSLAEGAIDVLSKPDPSNEQRQSADVAEQFLAYCNRETPGFLAQWFDKVCVKFGIGPKWARIEGSVEKPLK